LENDDCNKEGEPFCFICTEPISYIALGPCNHPYEFTILFC
jgi:hypothetical protein